jgi:hypothetical protein
MLKLRFLLVKLQMDYILSRRILHKQLAAFLTLPRNLSGTYEDMVQRIKSSGHQDDAETAMNALSWLLRAKRNLRMEELLEALAVYFELNYSYESLCESKLESSEIVEICKGFIVFDEESGFVRFCHETAYEFIKDEFESRLPPVEYQARVCLEYLRFHPNLTEHVRSQPCQRPFCSYALSHGADHVKGAQLFHEVPPDVKRLWLPIDSKSRYTPDVLPCPTCGWQAMVGFRCGNCLRQL